ncbi:MAG: TonB-dependent receptor [Flavobacteriales bacterium]|jgi:Fe(3+) dicitrate transport protein|nr:TonB-dependent receptor [Flavobacteriales bacterium]
MNRFLFFNILLFCSFVSFSQNKGVVFGKITTKTQSIEDQKVIAIPAINKTYYTDIKGNYQTDSIPFGSYEITFHTLGFEAQKKIVTIDKSSIKQNVSLKELAYEIDGVDITEEKKDLVGPTNRMRPIEGVLISQGKKNEVISVEETGGNKAINQGRQIYAQIPGLNIWESDGAGIQLGIGGRGLNPSRTSNYNTRQNGYDISADALGYPETYYTPPTEAVEKIQLIRGAAALQFGTQFGGLLNFVLKTGNEEKQLEGTIRQTVGSFGLSNTFLELGGSKKRWNYYVYGQYKTGNDFRPNSEFDVYAAGLNAQYLFNEKTSANIEFTKMNYLAHQPGGLTDLQFNTTPDTSYRTRNWFKVDWNLAALQFNHEFSSTTRLNSRFFGLIANRKALGVLEQINRVDPLTERDYILGEFMNFGNETRLLKTYSIKDQIWAFVVGARYYKGYNHSLQGYADSTDQPHFEYLNPNYVEGSDYEFPSQNISVFVEHIFALSKHFSITPGIRFESINTNANGWYRNTVRDLAGNIVFDEQVIDNQTNNRAFLIGGIGLNYKLNDSLEFYANASQNYRSINFTDMQIQNPNFRIDPNLEDEKGYNFDFGTRGLIGNKVNYDISLFLLAYNNRIGTAIKTDPVLFNVYQYRTNISQSLTKGIEGMIAVDWWKLLINDTSKLSVRTFVNTAFTDARYVNSLEPAYENKKVELVPEFTFKTGLRIGYKDFSTQIQYSYTSEHFSDATNTEQQANAVNGLIPAYSIVDWSVKYKWKRLQLETGINNLTNSIYFTRRATAYPGPGIIPSPPRNYFLTLQVKI